MAVGNNPYNNWENVRDNSDYRSRQTQASAYVKQQLNEDKYLTNTHRINPGRNFTSRKNNSSNATQYPHIFGKEDMWGWQRWAEVNTSTSIESNLVEDLLEGPTQGIPGTESYDPD